MIKSTNTHKFNDYHSANSKETPIKRKSRCGISPQRDRFICQNGQKSYFKQFPGTEKAHRNSIEIMVDLWSECNYRISENADISTVCWQSARGIYSKNLKSQEHRRPNRTTGGVFINAGVSYRFNRAPRLVRLSPPKPYKLNALICRLP